MQGIWSTCGRLRDYRERRRTRQAFKSDSSSTPGDSGYGSLGSSSDDECIPSPKSSPSLNGSVVALRPYEGSDWGDALLHPKGPQPSTRKIRSISIPYSRSSHPRRYTLGSCFSVGKGVDGTSEPKSRRSEWIRISDRFVPLRDPSASSTERFRTNKDVHTLTLPEQLLRRGTYSVDPFSNPARQLLSGASEGRVLDLRLAGSSQARGKANMPP